MKYYKNIIDDLNKRRAFIELDKIKYNKESLKPEDISRIAYYAHKNDYYLPLSERYGSLYLYFIEMQFYKEALFLYNKEITITDSDEDVIKSLDLSTEAYYDMQVLENIRKIYEDKKAPGYEEIYKDELENSIALEALKSKYPVKKRVRE